jgi:hypothetical protein
MGVNPLDGRWEDPAGLGASKGIRSPELTASVRCNLLVSSSLTFICFPCLTFGSKQLGAAAGNLWHATSQHFGHDTKV